MIVSQGSTNRTKMRMVNMKQSFWIPGQARNDNNQTGQEGVNEFIL